MRKPAFCICKNKGADQLLSYHATDQRLCFRYTYGTIPLLPKFQASSQTALSVSDLVGNFEDRFSCDVAQCYFYGHRNKNFQMKKKMGYFLYFY